MPPMGAHGFGPQPFRIRGRVRVSHVTLPRPLDHRMCSDELMHNVNANTNVDIAEWPTYVQSFSCGAEAPMEEYECCVARGEHTCHCHSHCHCQWLWQWLWQVMVYDYVTVVHAHGSVHV